MSAPPPAKPPLPACPRCGKDALAHHAGTRVLPPHVRCTACDGWFDIEVVGVAHGALPAATRVKLLPSPASSLDPGRSNGTAGTNGVWSPPWKG